MKRSHPFWTANLFEKKMKDESLVKCWTLRELRGSVNEDGLFVYDGKVKGDWSRSGNMPFFFSSRKWWGFVNGEWESEQKGREGERERELFHRNGIFGDGWHGLEWGCSINSIFISNKLSFASVCSLKSEWESDVLRLWVWVRAETCCSWTQRREAKGPSFFSFMGVIENVTKISSFFFLIGNLDCSPCYCYH